MEKRPVGSEGIVVTKPAGNAALETLTKVETQDRRRLEKVVKEGITQFIQVGEALAEIKRRRLYKSTHGSFETYCREMWGMSKTHANRLISSSEVAEDLAKLGPVPTSESAIRPLTILKPDQRARVWEEVQKTVPDPSSITANMLTRIIHEIVKPRKRAGKPGTDLPRLSLAQRHKVLSALEDWLKAKEEQGQPITPKDVVVGVKAVLSSL